MCKIVVYLDVEGNIKANDNILKENEHFINFDYNKFESKNDNDHW